jgi:hypothetical protein
MEDIAAACRESCGPGAEEAPELHIEAHEHYAAGQEQVESVTLRLAALGW